MLTSKDIPHFFVDPQDLNREDHLIFKYVFQTSIDPRLAAAGLCAEQSTAQWARPGVKEDLRPLHGAKVLSLRPHSKFKIQNSYEVCIAHPHRNFGARLPNLLSAAAGEGPFYCPGIVRIKWMDVEFPLSYLKQFSGPQFGVQGLREQLQVYDRPFFIGVVKPNLGLAPIDFAELAYQSWLGGLDIAKDDEMLGNMEWSPLVERARLCGQARLKSEENTACPKGYLASLTDEVETLESLLQVAVEAGANLVMINSIFTGLSALRLLRSRSPVPIMAHFTGMACFSRLPDFGISSLVFTKLQRLAGADIIGLAGFGDRMHNSEEEVLENIQACLEPLGPMAPALPVPGGSDWAGTLPTVYEKIGHTDFGFIAGRGVFGHPNGPSAGAQSLHQAWQAIRQNIPLKEFADHRSAFALREVLERFDYSTVR